MGLEFKVVKLGDPPSGWRMATCREFTEHRSECLNCPGMSAWAMCAVADGKIDGSGYGGKATPGAGTDGIGEMLIVRGGGDSGHSQPSGHSSSRSVSNVRKINYMDDIPDGYRLLSCDEFESRRSECMGFMGAWDILLLTDGKCDGSGYGGKATRQSRAERERSSSTNERMGEMLIGRDDGGNDLRDFVRQVKSEYDSYISQNNDTDLVNTFLTYSGRGRYEPSILVSSCPGDAHGGAHSRVKSFAEGNGWMFAPVQFSDSRDAADWKRLWKIQVEEFACRLMVEGKSTILEVKIDGGGAGCATERSRNMAQWWIDWVKRLGCDICADLQRRGTSAAFSVDGSVQIQIGQAVVSQDEFLEFNNAGATLTPVLVNGLGFEMHTLTLHPQKRYWVLNTDAFMNTGGDSYSREAYRQFSSNGTF